VTRWEKFGIVLLAASVLVAGLAAALGSSRVALIALLPITAFAGLASLGHFVTLDDDAPGGWSNPDDSTATWKRSLMELGIKFAVFFTLLATCLWFAN
jgi:hypothetical protein